MKKQFMLPAFLAIILFSLSASVLAQGEKAEKPAKTLSSNDKEVIIEIFKTIDASLYRFQFSKDESFGTKLVSPLSASDLRKGKKINFPNSISETYFPIMNFWFAVDKPTFPTEGLEGIFGKANVARLQAVINKYTGGK